jgi:predicted dehydrogenase/threonine dehydrogenase-like Zn-dependent dehydrogenase
MKQVLRKGLRHIVVEDVPEPRLQANHVLIRPAYSLISSGTETASLHQAGVVAELRQNPSHLQKIAAVAKTAGLVRTFAEVKAKFSEYAVLGYSGAGLVTEVHPTVTDIEPGQCVAFGGEGSGHAETVQAPRNLIVPVPPELPLEQACFATLGSIALHAVRTSNIGLGETVVVIGLGLVGQLIAQLVRQQGGTVVATDLRPDRTELASRLGVEHALGAEPAAEVRGLTGGRGADCVIVAAAAKSAGPCLLALEMCADRGRIVVVGAVPLDFPWYEMYRKEISLLMSRAYGPGSYDPSYEQGGHDYPIAYVRWTENRNMAEFLRLVRVGRVVLEPLITHVFKIDDAAAAYRTIMDPDVNSVAVLLRYPTADAHSRAVPVSALSAARHRVDVIPQAHSTGALRVALVGAGNLARWVHLPVIRKMKGVELRAVCSTSGARALSYAKRFAAHYCCSDYESLLRDADVDVIFILTRNQHHATQAIAALEAGKHVFVEKPMALTDEECQRLDRAVRETGRHLSVGFNRRFAPFYVEQKERLRRRTMPAVVNCRVNSPGIASPYWMADPAIGGAILGEACHFVDLMYWLLESEPIEVAAFTLPTGTTHPIGENNMVASFRFADGSVGNLTYCTIGSRTSGGERVEVFAEGIGVATEDFTRLDVRAGGRRTQSRWRPDKGYAELVESFVQAVRHGRAPSVTVRDGARATLGCLEMIESARTRSPRAIDLERLLPRED